MEGLNLDTIIIEVENHPIIYDKTKKDYFNKQLKEKAWEEISQKWGKPAEECKNRWKLLRERYSKELKRIDKPSGSGQTFKEPWYYLTAMEFLKIHIAPRRTRNNSDESSVFGLESSSTSIDDDTPSAKRNKSSSLDEMIDLFKETANTFTAAVSDLTKSSIPQTPLQALLHSAEVMVRDLPQADQDHFAKYVLDEAMRLRMDRNSPHNM